ncbi:MAG: 50S ribosomal protein L29 [Phycisphaerae bacterium]|nr:50S ribosomal protein L29 [Phycisphaerae bacterium]
MKISDTRNMNDQEIDLEIERLRDQLFHLRAQAVTEKLQDPTQLRKARRDIARLLTVKRERELNQGAGKAAEA